MNSSHSFRLQLFGRPSVRADGGDFLERVSVQRRRVALLALLALARERGVSRDKILGYLWPENDIDHARSLLNVAVYSLRKALGEEAIISDAEGLRLNSSLVRSDVADFETALGRDPAAAVALYSGAFLDGFFIADAPEFERWVEGERDRLGRLYCAVVEQFADQSEREGNFDRAAEWWKSRAAYDPYDSRVALRLMHALDASGNTAAALQHAVIHERRLKEDFAVEPPAELKNAAETLRARRDGVDGRVLSPDNSGKESVPEDHPAPASVKLTGASGLPAHDPAVPVLVASRESSRGRGLLWWKRRDALAAGILVVATSVAAFKLSNQTPDEMHDVSNRSIQSSTSLSTRSRNAQLTARHEAEDLYSQARYLTQATQDKEGYAKALALYSKAVERDPTFAKAYAGMADVYNYMEDPQRAKKSASKALALDSTMAEALNAIAYVYAYYDHRWLAADSAVERATRLSPRFTLAYLRRANINAALGRADVAFASLEKARAIEPESWIVLYNRGAVAAALGMNKEAIGYFESALALEPNRNGLRGELARQYWGVGRKDEAIALLRSLGDGTGAAIIAGDKSDLRALRRRFERDSTSLNSCQAASIYIELGEKDAAFRQLRRAVKDSRFLPLQLRSAPFVWLKDDPRYDQLRSDLGLQ